MAIVLPKSCLPRLRRGDLAHLVIRNIVHQRKDLGVLFVSIRAREHPGPHPAHPDGVAPRAGLDKP